MPKCPKCKKEITSINQDEMDWVRYPMGLDKNGEIDFGAHTEIVCTADENGDNTQYLCPECNEEVAGSYSEAESFLKGE